MATIPVEMTATAGAVLSAAEWNSNVRDGINFYLTNRPYCQVYNNAGVSCTNNTATLIPYDTEIADNDSMHSTVTNPSRLIFQTIGTYLVHVYIRWVAGATGIRTMNVRLNSGGSSGGGSSISTEVLNASSSSTATNERLFFYEPSFVGDYFETFGTQTNGGTLATDVGARVTGFDLMFLGT